MSSLTFFLVFIPILATILLLVNFILAPHKPYKDKDSQFECGFSSFTQMSRLPFSISFFIYALLFLLFDLEILLVYPYVISAYKNSIYGLIVMLVFFILLTIGFVFELGKKALQIDSRQTIEQSSINIIKYNKLNNLLYLNISKVWNILYIELISTKSLFKTLVNKYGAILGIIIVISILMLILSSISFVIYCDSDDEQTNLFKGKEVIVECNPRNSNDEAEHESSSKSSGKRKYVGSDDELENSKHEAPSAKSLGKRKRIDPSPEAETNESNAEDKSGMEEVADEILESDIQEALRNSRPAVHKYGESSKKPLEDENISNYDTDNESDGTSLYSSLNGNETPNTYEKKVGLLQRDEFIKEEQIDTYNENW